MSRLREKLTRKFYEQTRSADGARWVTDEERADAALAAFRAWLEAEGLAVVPKTPSENQFRAGSAFRYAVELSGYKDTVGIYTAMIAAAPDALAKDAP